MLLKDRVACVTGAGNIKSIGFATARTLAEQGAQVVLVDRDPEALAEAADRIGPAAHPVEADVSDRAAVARVAALVRETWGRWDVLVNNAGIARPKPTVEITDPEWDQMLDVNLRGTWMMIQAALPLMGPGSAIVCLASIAAQRGGGLMGGPHYAASKGGVLGLVRAVAREQGPRGIRVNAVNPGIIETGLTEGFYDDALTAQVMPQIPLARFGRAQDVANCCLYLASDLSAYVTGSALDVNGGMHMS